MDTKNIFIAGVVAAIVSAITVSLFAPVPPAPQSASDILGGISGQVQQNIWRFAAGVSLDPSSGNGAGGSTIFTRSGTIVAGQNIAFWTNKTGRTVLADYGDIMTTGGYASSSMRVSMFATTTVPTSSTWFNIAKPGLSTTTASNFLIDNMFIPTSTPPNYIFNSDVIPAGATNATGTIPVLDGQTLVVLLRQENSNFCTGANCEAATSTNRGFNLNWFVGFHYFP